MAYLVDAPTGVSVIPVAGSTGARGERGDPGEKGDKGEKGDPSLVPGPPGAGAQTSRLASANVPQWTAVVPDGPGYCAPADPSNPNHKGIVLGVTAQGGAQGTLIQIQSSGDLDGPETTWSGEQTLYVGAGGAVVPTAPTSGWLQAVGASSSSSHMVVSLGIAETITPPASGAQIPASGAAQRATAAKIAAGTDDSAWISALGLSSVLAPQLTRSNLASKLALPLPFVTMAGYAAVGDLGAGAVYARSATQGLLGIQAQGAWYNLSLPGRIANPAWFGAKGDGATDDTAAWQAAVDTGFPVVASTPPASYLINSTVLLRIGSIVRSDGPSAITKIVVTTTSDLPTFRGAGNSQAHNALISGIEINHSGDAIVIDFGYNLACEVRNCTIRASKSTSTKPIIYYRGSFTKIISNRVDNFRTTNSYVVHCDRRQDDKTKNSSNEFANQELNIESLINDNYFAGTGSGILIGASEDCPRPEGVSVSRNGSILQGVGIKVEAILWLKHTDNTWDQARPYAMWIQPIPFTNGAGQKVGGVTGINSSGNWLSTPADMINGSGLYHDNAGTGALGQSYFADSTFKDHFAYCGYGAVLRFGCTEIDFAGSIFYCPPSALLRQIEGLHERRMAGSS
ncbi:hypothetical protein [Methylobacterium dankookense]|uniref:Pectate lyase superfamily protein domain-containing protein n=1 Tax=Methylobacterium dankookense TaxID=560405 RepID=A0A564G6J1_9HYPH|nr:hypothetical protein [Methylobacterium dankookense]VUF15654.1 hypothetical protein MTDSW087_05398 [Methylobacterium dankookense]